MIYLFIGQDNLSKEIQLKKLKEAAFPKALAHFNLDTLYARELSLKGLQEKLLLLPMQAKMRMILIKDSGRLKEEVREYLVKHAKDLPKPLVLVLDFEQTARRDDFIAKLSRLAKVFRFGQEPTLDTFDLVRQIELRRTDGGLRLLSRLFDKGEKAERILGGLRFAWDKETIPLAEKRKRLRLLLNCDLEVKRGKLNPEFALEKLVVSLCSLPPRR